MSALKKRHMDHGQRIIAPKREIPPADYSDEITAEELEAARKEIGDMFDDWEVVDGPAW